VLLFIMFGVVIFGHHTGDVLAIKRYEGYRVC